MSIAVGMGFFFFDATRFDSRFPKSLLLGHNIQCQKFIFEKHCAKWGRQLGHEKKQDKVRKRLQYRRTHAECYKDFFFTFLSEQTFEFARMFLIEKK